MLVFSIKNPYGEQEKKNILFEPSEKLPQMLRGTTSLGQGQQLYFRLENTSEEDQVIDPNWGRGRRGGARLSCRRRRRKGLKVKGH